jgi:hypothetical protein
MMSDITPTGDMMSYRELAEEYGRVLAQRDELVEALDAAWKAIHCPMSGLLHEAAEKREAALARVRGGGDG